MIAHVGSVRGGHCFLNEIEAEPADIGHATAHHCSSLEVDLGQILHELPLSGPSALLEGQGSRSESAVLVASPL